MSSDSSRIQLEEYGELPYRACRRVQLERQVRIYTLSSQVLLAIDSLIMLRVFSVPTAAVQLLSRTPREFNGGKDNCMRSRDLDRFGILLRNGNGI